MRTPPGLSPAKFAAAVEEFGKIVGPEWVFTSDEDLDLYRDAYTPLRDLPEERIASAAVAPSTTEQVQAVVRIANRDGIPLHAISTGKNLGYGGSAPVYSGSVVLDLKRMNRIIEVDDRNHYAIVEPGVSYFDLYNYIQEKKLKVWIDCPDPGWGSVVGNALDRGVGYTTGRFRNHFDAHCGMEVVLANGELLRTGMGAMPNSATWPAHKAGFGPFVDGIFSQSNFGIITKMGFWLMPQPEAYMHGTIYANRYDDLHALVDALNYIENSGLAQGFPQLGSPLLGIGDNRQVVDMFFDGPPKMADEHKKLIAESKIGFSTALARYGASNALPYWKLKLIFYGPPKVVAAQWEAVRDLATKAIPGASFKSSPVLTLPIDFKRNPDVYAQMVGIPNLEFFAFGSRAGGNPEPSSGHMWFSPVIPRTAQAIFDANRVFSEATRTIDSLKVPMFGIKPFAMPTGLLERSFLLILGFPVTQDAKQNAAFVEAFRTLIRVGAEQGWGEYRTGTLFQDDVMRTYSFNNNSLLRFNEALKDAVDPNGILSPGRYGIWPKHMRDKAQ